MIGSLIGAGLSAVGSIFGMRSASEAMQSVKENINSQKQENKDLYIRRYNEDVTQRADAQRILTKTEESIKNRNRQAAGAQAVMGGTEESVAAAKAANNQAIAEASSRIAANADARKDQIEQTYQQNNANLNDALNKMEFEKVKAISSAVQGVAQAGSEIAKSDFNFNSNSKSNSNSNSNP